MRPTGKVSPITGGGTGAGAAIAKRFVGEFGKEPVYLRPVRSPNFYAVKCYPDFLCTLGGIKINERLEALDKK